MFIEIMPEAHDFEGRLAFKPGKERRPWVRPNLLVDRLLTQPTSDDFTAIESIRGFLLLWRYVSDMERFGKLDY